MKENVQKTLFVTWQDKENCSVLPLRIFLLQSRLQPSERLAPLSIMTAQLLIPPRKSLEQSGNIVPSGCRGCSAQSLLLLTKLSLAHREINSESCEIKPNLDCNYTFPIDLVPNGISFSTRSIGKG